ncbi:hemagglutinin protein [Pseudomonas sp. NPDC090233]|uniref:hemagglutinin protein n=1 Tax=Pseudomonas sp. NPDC090233 TaxID=3364479 RepID=UPI00383B746B
MSEATFEQIATGLYRLSSLGDSGVANYWAGYLASPDSNLGQSASLAQTWADEGGAYLFLAATPADPSTFVSELRNLWPTLSAEGWLRFLWISNPMSAPSQWHTQSIDARPVNDSFPAHAWRVVRNARFPLGGYAVVINAGAILEAGTDFIAFLGSEVAFAAPGDVYPSISQFCPLPLVGAQLGCLTFTVNASHGSETPNDDMQRLGVMLRYSEPEAQSPVDAVNIIDMPLFQQLQQTPFNLLLSFDPLNPHTPGRTALSFDTQDGPAPALQFAQRTNNGHATRATPRAGSGVLPGGRLCFGRTPLHHNQAPYSADMIYHLAPDGLFVLEPSLEDQSNDEHYRLTLGMTGTETVVLPRAGVALLLFQANGAAYLPPASNDNAMMSLTDLGTTAYATVLSDSDKGFDYQAQPPSSPLFDVTTASAEGVLPYLNLTATTLPTLQASQQTPPTVWPMGVYGRIAAAAIDRVMHLEDAFLAPRRRRLIGQTGAQTQPGSTTLTASEQAADSPPWGVTANGLVALLNPARTAWNGVLFANLPQSAPAQLILTEVKPPLQVALQSNQLFMVVANVDTFMTEGTSVAYQLTADNASKRLMAAGVPDEKIEKIRTVLASMTPHYPRFDHEKAFDSVIRYAGASDYLPQARAAASLLRADIEGWTFQLSPRAWRPDTLMLFKYCSRAITDLATDTDAWSWQEVAKGPDGSLTSTQAALAAIISKARLVAQDPTTPADNPLKRFYQDVLDNPRWSGVLFLNAPVDLQALPTALAFVAAGVDPTDFYAHHLGFSDTPFMPRDALLELGQTAVFGLIDYNDPDDLLASTNVPFGYKIQGLQVRFENARVVDFSAHAELMVNRLFGSWLTKVEAVHGNNLILTGSYQRIGGQPNYAFRVLGDNRYQTAGAALSSVDIRDCRLQIAEAAEDGMVTANFVLSGRLAFVELPEFDLFGYGPGTDFNGYLSFHGLVVAISFPLGTPDQQHFTSFEAGVELGNAPGASLARRGSLVENFPLSVDGLVAAPDLGAEGQPPEGATPESLGFTSIGAPLEQTPLKAPWFGLSLALNVGTLGALSGAIGLKVTLLAAWDPQPQSGTAAVYLGLKLGISNALNGSLPLQGVLKLGFRSFQFETWRDADNRLNYLLRMHRFALSVLAWSFPPGNSDLLLFGAPGKPKSALGWYAAYAKDDAEKKPALLTAPAPRQVSRQPPSPQRLARSGRRTPPVI